MPPDADAEQQPATRDWAKVAVIGIGALLTVVLALVVLLPRRTTDIAYRVTSIDLRDPRLVHVTFEVEKPPLAEARCDLAFFDGDGQADGRLIGIVVPPRRDNQRVTRLTQDFRPVEPVARAAVSQCVLTRTH